jgi:hypothetical protein
MFKKVLSSLTVILALTLVHSQANSCSPECGVSTAEFKSCADYEADTSDPNKCYTCSAGNIGGSGRNDGIGALCKAGKTAPGCAASINSTDSKRCYICKIGFYDINNDLSKASPCEPCNSDCKTCVGPKENDCLTCSEGLFDAGSSPYSPGSCDKCDPSCTFCFESSTNCVGCCQNGYVRNSRGYCVLKA